MGEFHPVIPIGISLLTGGLMLWLVKKLFQWAGRLQSSGTLNLENAMGQEGTVYLTIRPGKPGKVQLAVQERVTVWEAITEKQEELKTGQTVRVVKISAGCLVVEKSEDAKKGSRKERIMTLTWPVLLLIWCSIAALVLFFLVMFLASRYRRSVRLAADSGLRVHESDPDDHHHSAGKRHVFAEYSD